MVLTGAGKTQWILQIDYISARRYSNNPRVRACNIQLLQIVARLYNGLSLLLSEYTKVISEKRGHQEQMRSLLWNYHVDTNELFLELRQFRRYWSSFKVRINIQFSDIIYVGLYYMLYMFI